MNIIFQALQMKVMNLCKNLFTKVKDFVYDPLRVGQVCLTDKIPARSGNNKIS